MAAMNLGAFQYHASCSIIFSGSLFSLGLTLNLWRERQLSQSLNTPRCLLARLPAILFKSRQPQVRPVACQGGGRVA